jgi:AcrR family transcriptional regulator
MARMPSASGAKSGRRDRHKAEIRERLFRSALGLYLTRGLHSTTVHDITEAADVGKGTFFNYFPTKEHVLVDFYEMQKGRVEDALRTVREERGPVRKTLIEMMRRLSGEAARSPLLTRSFLLALVSSDAVAQLVMPRLQARQDLYEELLLIGQERGEVRNDKPAAELARVLLEAAFGTAMFWSCRPQLPLDQLLLANLDLLCARQASETIAVANGASERITVQAPPLAQPSVKPRRASKRRARGTVPRRAGTR